MYDVNMKMFTVHTLSLLLVASLFAMEVQSRVADVPTVLVGGEIGLGDRERDFPFQGWAALSRSFTNGKVKMANYVVELPMPLRDRIDRSQPLEVELGFGQKLKVPAKLVDGRLEFTTFGDFAEGLNVKARLRLKADSTAWKVPLRSLVAPFGGVPQVWTVQNDVIRAHPVFVFGTDLNHVRVFTVGPEFLPTERVVLGGQQKVSAGSRVRAVQQGDLK